MQPGDGNRLVLSFPHRQGLPDDIRRASPGAPPEASALLKGREGAPGNRTHASKVRVAERERGQVGALLPRRQKSDFPRVNTWAALYPLQCGQLGSPVPTGYCLKMTQGPGGEPGQSS